MDNVSMEGMQRWTVVAGLPRAVLAVRALGPALAAAAAARRARGRGPARGPPAVDGAVDEAAVGACHRAYFGKPPAFERHKERAGYGDRQAAGL